MIQKFYNCLRGVPSGVAAVQGVKPSSKLRVTSLCKISLSSGSTPMNWPWFTAFRRINLHSPLASCFRVPSPVPNLVPGIQRTEANQLADMYWRHLRLRRLAGLNEVPNPSSRDVRSLDVVATASPKRKAVSRAPRDLCSFVNLLKYLPSGELT